MVVEARPSVWMLIQQTFCRISLIFVSAWALRCFSVRPWTLPHHELLARYACFYIARAPTVSKGGFGFPQSSSGVRIV